VVSTCAPPTSSDISENLLGAVHAMFAQGANQVSIDVRPDGPSDVAVLRAYDAADNLINTVTSPPGVTGTLSIGTPGPPIRGVRFSGNGSQFARFDNLKVYLIARLIDFDHDTNGAAIANGTNVGSNLSAVGRDVLVVGHRVRLRNQHLRARLHRSLLGQLSPAGLACDLASGPGLQRDLLRPGPRHLRRSVVERLHRGASRTSPRDFAVLRA
jgi:hypothetical protein